jgi:hypothetical protein
MARYIDAEALTERLRLQFCKDCNNYNEIRCRSCDIDDTIDFIEDAPAADVVEVVRCKDCGHKGAAFCMAGDFPLTKENENAFCSYGERKVEYGNTPSKFSKK